MRGVGLEVERVHVGAGACMRGVGLGVHVGVGGCMRGVGLGVEGVHDEGGSGGGEVVGGEYIV